MISLFQHHVFGFASRLGDLVKALANVLETRMTCRRIAQGVALPFDEGNVERILQPAHTLFYRRRSNMQMFRCTLFTHRLREADSPASTTTMAAWTKIATLVFVLLVIRYRDLSAALASDQQAEQATGRRPLAGRVTVPGFSRSGFCSGFR
jgi:hypothetical protein